MKYTDHFQSISAQKGDSRCQNVKLSCFEAILLDYTAQIVCSDWLVNVSRGDENRILAVSVLAYKNDGILQLLKKLIKFKIYGYPQGPT